MYSWIFYDKEKLTEGELKRLEQANERLRETKKEQELTKLFWKLGIQSSVKTDKKSLE